MPSYFEKLRDPRWQKKRLEILQRADWKCEDCKESTQNLQVHHKYYNRGSEPWDYPDASLVCCCETCHEVREQIAHMSRILFQNMPVATADKIIDELGTMMFLDNGGIDRLLEFLIKDNNQPSVRGDE